MKWIKTSERLPEQEKEYCLRWADTKEPFTSMFSKKHGFEVIVGFHNTDVEWLDEESNVSSQEPNESKKTVFMNNDTLVKLMLQYIKLDYAIMRKREEKNEAVKRQDFQSAVTIREQEVELTKKYFALCDELQIKDLNPQEPDATAPKEIGEPLVQNKSNQ